MTTVEADFGAGFILIGAIGQDSVCSRVAAIADRQHRLLIERIHSARSDRDARRVASARVRQMAGPTATLYVRGAADAYARVCRYHARTTSPFRARLSARFAGGRRDFEMRHSPGARR